MMDNVKTGKPDVTHDAPAHTPGVKQGNSAGSYDSQDGHKADGRSTARRSTGINPEGREPIDPSMPNLSPA